MMASSGISRIQEVMQFSNCGFCAAAAVQSQWKWIERTAVDVREDVPYRMRSSRACWALSSINSAVLIVNSCS